MNSNPKKYNSFCQEFLIIEFEKRQLKNPSYSIRAFARDLGVGKTTVCDVMNGSRQLSALNIDVIATRLSLDSETIKKFLEDNLNTDRGRAVLLEDEFQLIKDWHFLAILNLAKLPNNQCSGEWIAERLGLKFEVAESSLETLLKLGLLENLDGKLIRTSMPLTTATDVPSESIREHHRQSMEKAIDAMQEVSVALRDFTSVTYAIHPEKIPDVKKVILSFHRKLGKMLHAENATEVYRLNVQFFPLTKSENQIHGPSNL
jgi:hypothetical protein